MSAGASAGVDPSSAGPSTAARPLERTMFSYDPIDEFTATVADWIYFHAKDLSNVEIEAKIGTLVDTSTNERVFLPVLTETVLTENTGGIRFVSQLAKHHHSKVNTVLNQLVTYTNAKSYKGTKLSYKRQMEVDFFHKLNPAKLAPGLLESIPQPRTESGPVREDRLRVTRDPKGASKLDHAVIKRRIASLEVYCPKRPYDYRISINTETPVPLPEEGDKPTYWREKNRMTYKHELVQVDLTVVDSINPQKGKETSCELEVEFQDANELLKAGHESRAAGASQDWTPYDDMCHIFLNNIRMLMRNLNPVDG